MEEKLRLTKRRKDGSPRMSCSRCPEYGPRECNGNCLDVAVGRLANIEDILGMLYDLEDLKTILDGNRTVRICGFAGGADADGRSEV